MVLEIAYVPASAEIANAHACPLGQTTQRALCVRGIEGEPFSYLVTYVPEAIARTFTRRELASKPLLALLERSGVRISRAEQVITAQTRGYAGSITSGS